MLYSSSGWLRSRTDFVAPTIPKTTATRVVAEHSGAGTQSSTQPTLTGRHCGKIAAMFCARRVLGQTRASCATCYVLSWQQPVAIDDTPARAVLAKTWLSERIFSAPTGPGHISTGEGATPVDETAVPGVWKTMRLVCAYHGAFKGVSSLGYILWRDPGT